LAGIENRTFSHNFRVPRYRPTHVTLGSYGHLSPGGLHLKQADEQCGGSQSSVPWPGSQQIDPVGHPAVIVVVGDRTDLVVALSEGNGSVGGAIAANHRAEST
jgi:hypothetical protein